MLLAPRNSSILDISLLLLTWIPTSILQSSPFSDPVPPNQPMYRLGAYIIHQTHITITTALSFFFYFVFIVHVVDLLFLFFSS